MLARDVTNVATSDANLQNGGRASRKSCCSREMSRSHSLFGAYRSIVGCLVTPEFVPLLARSCTSLITRLDAGAAQK